MRNIKEEEDIILNAYRQHKVLVLFFLWFLLQNKSSCIWFNNLEIHVFPEKFKSVTFNRNKISERTERTVGGREEISGTPLS